MEYSAIYKNTTIRLKERIKMFNKVSEVKPLEDMQLEVKFISGETKIYDVKPLLEKFEVFKKLKNIDLFNKVKVDMDGYGIMWDEEVDLACDELWYNGKTVG